MRVSARVCVQPGASFVHMEVDSATVVVLDLLKPLWAHFNTDTVVSSMAQHGLSCRRGTSCSARALCM